MEENYCTIKEVIKKRYTIGTYQRGYRWDEDNVKELLDDIFEGKLIEDFDFGENKYSSTLKVISDLHDKVKNSSKHLEDYCLQPLVVKKKNEGYNVIDGQQRLTTIYIILKVLSEIYEDFYFPESFEITYESRQNSTDFLKDILKQKELNDIDSAYMLETLKTAKEWFAEKNRHVQELIENYNADSEQKFEAYFLDYLEHILLDETKFIWDEIDENSPNYKKSEQKIFADRNTGKLDLTDSELIKAIFMNPEYYGSDINIKDRQILISEIWDIYENELGNEKLWKFIPIDDENRRFYEQNTKIDAIFYLILLDRKIENKLSENDGLFNETKNRIKTEIENELIENNGLFKETKKWIKTEIENETQNNNRTKTEVMIKCWRKVCDVFDGIKELYEDNEIYNLLSLYKMLESDLIEVYIKYKLILKKDKDIRKNYIKDIIEKKLFQSEDISSIIKGFRYPHQKENIRNVLFAYNVAITNTLLPIEKFEFSEFERDEKNGVWDIEHIYSTNENYMKNAKMADKIELLKIFSQDEDNIYKNYLEYLYNTKLEDEVSAFDLSLEKQENEAMEEFWNKSREKYDKYFDFWRFLKLKEFSQKLLKENEIKEKLQEILMDKMNFENRAEQFLQSDEYDEEDVFTLITSNFLYWDKEAEREFEKIKENKKIEFNWHGHFERISPKEDFWNEYNEENDNYKENFITTYYRIILRYVYDNSGIESDYITKSNHGKRKSKIINEENIEFFKAFFRGTIDRINENINYFFRNDKKIDVRNIEKGKATDYDTLSLFINDNSMGNMMLLLPGINRASLYRDANFSSKRKYIAKLEKNVFLPLGTSNVLMGKFIDLETSTEQWLMKERMNYLEDIIKVMEDYYKYNGLI